MASIRERVSKDGKRSFHVQVRMQGYPSRTASFPTLRAAQRWAKSIEGDMVDGRHFRSVEARRRTLADAIDKYLEDEVPKKRSGGDMHKAALAWWRNEIGHLRLANITPGKLVEARDKLAQSTYQRAKSYSSRTTIEDEPKQYRRSKGTVNRYLACLSHVFSVARREWHWVDSNPVTAVSRLAESKGRVRYLSEEERKALLAETAKDPMLHTFTVIALSTACRAGELQNLEWRDVDLKQGRLLFQQTKNDTPRAAWLHGEALRLLELHAKVRKINGGLVFESAKGKRYDYRKPFMAALERVGIEGAVFHTLRHSAATYLAQLGATEQQLRAIGGWKSTEVQKYVHLAAEDTKGALKRLSERVGDVD